VDRPHVDDGYSDDVQWSVGMIPDVLNKVYVTLIGPETRYEPNGRESFTFPCQKWKLRLLFQYLVSLRTAITTP